MARARTPAGRGRTITGRRAPRQSFERLGQGVVQRPAVGPRCPAVDLLARGVEAALQPNDAFSCVESVLRAETQRFVAGAVDF